MCQKLLSMWDTPFKTKNVKCFLASFATIEVHQDCLDTPQEHFTKS